MTRNELINMASMPDAKRQVIVPHPTEPGQCVDATFVALCLASCKALVTSAAVESSFMVDIDSVMCKPEF